MSEMGLTVTDSMTLMFIRQLAVFSSIIGRVFFRSISTGLRLSREIVMPTA